MMITIMVAIAMLGTASFNCILILGLCDAAPGLLKRRNPVINALQHVLLMLLKILSCIAFLLSLRLLLIDSKSGGQQRKRENNAERKHDMFQHFCLLKIVNWIAYLLALYYAPLRLTAWRRLG
jgi:hypothetical protein